MGYGDTWKGLAPEYKPETLKLAAMKLAFPSLGPEYWMYLESLRGKGGR